MKTNSIIRLFAFFILLMAESALLAQVECEVLIPALAGEYEGKCKKGLAHGKGVAKGIDRYEGNFKKGLPHGKGRYEWSTGELYVGEWSAGLRHGIGEYQFFQSGRDTVLAGIWENDRYKGPKPIPPKIIRKYNISRVNFHRQGDGNRVELTVYDQGSPTTNLQNFMIAANNGTEYRIGQSVGYENIEFPFTCQVNYTRWNALRTEQFDVVLEFEVKQPGFWIVKVYN